MGKLERADWVGIAGTFLILSSIAGLLWSTDKTPLTQAGRVATAGVGVGLLVVKICV